MQKISCVLLVIIMACGSSSRTTGRAGDTIVVMSYNIHHANPPSRGDEIDIDTIAGVIRRYDPDIVALQEVDVNTGRSKMDQARLLAEKTGMHVYFAKAIDHDGGDYGVAILSKMPLKNARTHPLPTAAGSGGEPRVLATADIVAGGRPLTIACTHLDAQRGDTNRIMQMQAINDILRQNENPVIIGGDFNAEPGSEVIRLLDSRFTRTCVSDCGFTIPVDEPRKTIDFIAYAPSAAYAMSAHEVIPERYASDHLPVLATVTFE